MIQTEFSGSHLEFDADGVVTKKPLEIDIELGTSDGDVSFSSKNNEVDINGMSIRAPFNMTLETGMKIVTGNIVHIETTSYWNSHPGFIGIKNHLYVYSDWDQYDGKNIPAMKVGDGTSYLIDQPFISTNVSLLMNHIHDNIRHITQEEREFWNNKVRCDDTQTVDSETLIFTVN